MSDLIKEARVEAKALATSGVKGAGNMINALADALEAKDAEIERLTASIESKDKIIQSQRRAYFQKSTENAKQKVVVGSARAYFKRRKSVYSDLLEDALAALDAQEGDRPPGFDCECGAHGPSECVCGADKGAADSRQCPHMQVTPMGFCVDCREDVLCLPEDITDEKGQTDD